MTRDEATSRLNDFLKRHYRQITLTSDDLNISNEPCVWLFKQSCTGDVCKIPHPPEILEPLIHRVVFREYYQKPTFEVWETLRNGTCRVCGSSAHPTQEVETLTFHYPDSVETQTVVVDYMNCEKCGKLRI